VLLPTDLLTAHGFLYFEKPFVVEDRHAADFSLKAISWAPFLGDRGSRRADMAGRRFDGQSLLDYFAERDYAQMWNEIDVEDRDDNERWQPDGLAITIYQEVSEATKQDWASRKVGSLGPLPSLVSGHLTPWWFGMPFEGNEVDILGNPTGARWWWKIAQTTFRLMQQQLATRSRYTPSRPARRDAKRHGFRDDGEVVVVRLRRAKGESHGEAMGEAHYSHQFIVGGHWRAQNYPSEGVTRQIWISPYVKGPRDAPLIIRPRRVYTWSR
jgi:hypothetical protein